MARKYQKFTPEFREQAAKLVVEAQRPIVEVAREHGLGETTLGNWVRKYRDTHAGEELARSRRWSCRSAPSCRNCAGGSGSRRWNWSS